MKNKKTLIIILIALFVIIAGSTLLYNYLSTKIENDQFASQDTHQNNLAPDFTVYDADGNEHNLLDFKGKPVILNFWASWCAPCKSEMPDFDDAYKEYKDDISFIMLNLTDGNRETLETALSYIESQGYSFPVYYDTASSAAYSYSVYSVPTTYFIDKDGYLIAQAQGAIDKNIIKQGIDMIKDTP